MPREQQIEIPPMAPFFEQVQALALRVLAEQSVELRTAGVLAAAELAENVLKFGGPLPSGAAGSVRVRLEADTLCVESECGASPDGFRSVARVIERVTACEDTSVLYVERLNALLTTDSAGSAGLGLLRLAHEGKFALACRYDEPLLTIAARRALA